MQGACRSVVHSSGHESHIDIPFWGRFHYSRAEVIADSVVHAVGIVLAIAAGSALLSLSAFHADPGEYVAVVFYVVSLLTVLSISLAYNLWPLTPAKWMLRRFDHAAIYLLIAGTYTPFLVQLEPEIARPMLALVWGAALVGIAIKLLLPGRFDRLAVGFYLAIGWSGMAVATRWFDPPESWMVRRRSPSRRSSSAVPAFAGSTAKSEPRSVTVESQFSSSV